MDKIQKKCEHTYYYLTHAGHMCDECGLTAAKHIKHLEKENRKYKRAYKTLEDIKKLFKKYMTGKL